MSNSINSLNTIISNNKFKIDTEESMDNAIAELIRVTLEYFPDLSDSIVVKSNGSDIWTTIPKVGRVYSILNINTGDGKILID